VERSHELLAPAGTLALLLPVKLATAGYARACRDGLAHSATLHRVADLADDARAGFDATTYPLVIIASRGAPPPEHVARIGLTADAPATSQQAWRDAESWVLAPARVQQLAARLAAVHPPLSDAVTPQLGVKSGANAAFLDPPESLAPWSRRALRGRDIRAFRLRAPTRLLWPADAHGEPWRNLPPQVGEYLATHRTTLSRRVDLHDALWWRLFRTRAATAPHRVAWGDLARRLEATLVPDADVIPINSCYVAALPSAMAAKALTAWLNCTWIRALARLRAEPAAGGAARFGARTVGAVPLPSAVLRLPDLAAMTDAAATRDVQADLDECSADLLDLTHDDRAALATLASHRR
jgi:hypothetical protein